MTVGQEAERSMERPVRRLLLRSKGRGGSVHSTTKRDGRRFTMQHWKYAVSAAEQRPQTSPLPLEGDLYEVLEQAAALGYDGIELHAREYVPFDYERIKESGCKISMLVTGRLFTEGNLSLLDGDPAKVDACLESMKIYLDKTAKLGAGIVLGWAKGTVAPGQDREAALRMLGERLQILDQYGSDAGAPIVIEAINRYETNLFHTAGEILRFLDTYHLENCYVHLDTFHMNIEEADLCGAIRLCGKRLGYFHVADNTRRYPGSGHLNFNEIFAALDDIGYSGWVNVECLPVPDGITAARQALHYLKKCEAGNAEPSAVRSPIA